MTVRILQGDCREVLRTLPEQSVHCCVTSPPYFGLRDYGHAGQIGLEQTPAEYVEQMVAVFREVRRVLRDDGTLWLNLGDSYANSHPNPKNDAERWDKSGLAGIGSAKYRETLAASAGQTIVKTAGLRDKNLIGIPWRVAFALQADGWYLRQDIIWSKPNPMPESVRDRCTKAHEYVFLLSKSERYYFDSEAMQEPAIRAGSIPGGGGGYIQHSAGGHNKDGLSENAQKPVAETRNKRSVWTIATQPFAEAHFATMAPELAETCIKAGCPAGGTVLDPFGGAGTTGLVADQLQRDATLIELNPSYIDIARRRIASDAPLFAEVAA